MTKKKQAFIAVMSGFAVMVALDVLGFGFWPRQIGMMITVGIVLCVTEWQAIKDIAHKK